MQRTLRKIINIGRLNIFLDLVFYAQEDDIFGMVLLHINPYRLFNAKSSIYICLKIIYI